jgi:acetyl-CoA/propionyl-CoA carboxylase biotin carboxyl carrier protein
MFSSLLVANRGEIAVRILATARRMGIRTIAVYSDADEGAAHVLAADAAVRLGPAPAAQSYLDVARVMAAVAASGASAVHPGYGFLSESAGLAAACAAAGVVFVGPSAEALATMGDKIRAKAAVSAAGVAVVAGRSAPGMTDAQLTTAADEVGYPVLVKPAAGGGGKGMHRVDRAADLPAALAQARREAAASFGDDTLFVERFLPRPRHIEVQILADAHGSAIHLGERECSLQRRQQKVVEEAPSPLLDPDTRERICAAGLAAAGVVDYTGAGTVEFLVSAQHPTEFFFIEMNTRLQVEHPVTEAVTGIDLVEWQLRIAAGQPLGVRQSDVVTAGHAVEARLYAEDPARSFLPTGGTVLALREPSGPGVRVDGALRVGTVVGSDYDPMLAKVIAHGPDRAVAFDRLDRALAETAVLGVTTNRSFLRAVLARPEVRAGDLDTGLLERCADDLVDHDIPVAAWVAYALHRLADLAPAGNADPWVSLTGWRVGGRVPVRWRVADPAGRTVEVSALGEVGGPRGAASVTIDGARHQARSVTGVPGAAADSTGGGEVLLTVDGHSQRVLVASVPRDPGTVWVSLAGGTWRLSESPAAGIRAGAVSVDTAIRSPMPGTVTVLSAVPGHQLSAGEPVLVVEAMKMEHSLAAPAAGTVEILVAVGQHVDVDQVVARIHPLDT